MSQQKFHFIPQLYNTLLFNKFNSPYFPQCFNYPYQFNNFWSTFPTLSSTQLFHENYTTTNCTEVSLNQTERVQSNKEKISNFQLEIEQKMDHKNIYKNQIDEKNEQFEAQQRKLKRIKAIKKIKYQQNPTRNIITNIGNQLLTFLSNKKKTGPILKKLNPDWDALDLDLYYELIQNLKSKLKYYLNIQILKQFWFSKVEFSQITNMKMIRILSRYFLNDIMLLSLLNSKRIKKQSKIMHIQARRILLKHLLKN